MSNLDRRLTKLESRIPCPDPGHRRAVVRFADLDDPPGTRPSGDPPSCPTCGGEIEVIEVVYVTDWREDVI